MLLVSWCLRQDCSGLVIGALSRNIPVIMVPAGPMSGGLQMLTKQTDARRLPEEISRKELLEAEVASYHGRAPALFMGQQTQTRC